MSGSRAASPVRRPMSATSPTSERSFHWSASRSSISTRCLSKARGGRIRGSVLRCCRILFDFLDECQADAEVLADVFAYDLSDPEIVRQLEAFGPRLRIVIDNSDKHGKPNSDEGNAAARLVARSEERRVGKEGRSRWAQVR